MIIYKLKFVKHLKVESAKNYKIAFFLSFTCHSKRAFDYLTMWAKSTLIVFILIILNSCSAVSKCRNKCKTNAYACYLLFTDNSISSTSKVLGYLFCQILENDCNGSCGGSGSSSSSSRSSSSSSSSSGGSSGGGSSGGSGGSSHEISPPF